MCTVVKKKTKKRATHNQYFKECAVLTASGDKAPAYFATHAETVLCLLGLYCEESGLALQQGELVVSRQESWVDQQDRPISRK